MEKENKKLSELDFEERLKRELIFGSVDTDILDFNFLMALSKRMDEEEKEWMLDLIIRLIGEYR